MTLIIMIDDGCLVLLSVERIAMYPGTPRYYPGIVAWKHFLTEELRNVLIDQSEIINSHLFSSVLLDGFRITVSVATIGLVFPDASEENDRPC